MNNAVQAIPKQIPLDLGIEVQKDINGIEMGVLENGIPYLTQRGLLPGGKDEALKIGTLYQDKQLPSP
ncbi:hypothetical protein ACO0LD_16130 [Undibacterium sp. Ji83W]|uniref:hypothetical protein n=1 Tax=Undibacterium sp. Ji83W TaxID=3413043 RepID=UPI003BEFE2F7